MPCLSCGFVKSSKFSSSQDYKQTEAYLETYYFNINDSNRALKYLTVEVDAQRPNLIERIIKIVKGRFAKGPRGRSCAFFFDNKIAGRANLLAAELGSILIDGENILARANVESNLSPAGFLRERLERPDVREKGCVVSFNEESFDLILSLFKNETPARYMIGSLLFFGQHTEIEIKDPLMGKYIKFDNTINKENSIEFIVHEMLFSY